ncbi:MAG: hypothetical protein JNM91_05580, partial [Flavobacteriales bacterium]|nr:hypothetical protein [Flavobacteriales bacterium]
MPSALKNILAVFAGLLAGGLVNMCLVMISASVIPPPAGVDVNDPASLATHIHLFGWKHF